jgi:hypothetical protein
LRPFGHCSLTVETSNTSGGRQSTSVRTRQISDRCSATSHEPIQRHESLESYATTRSDVMLSTNSSVQQQHIDSLTIDEGTHRDHLGLVSSLQSGFDCHTNIIQHSSGRFSATYELPSSS